MGAEIRAFAIQNKLEKIANNRVSKHDFFPQNQHKISSSPLKGTKMKEYHAYDVNHANSTYDHLTEKNVYMKHRENSRELRARNERNEIREERRRERDRERRLAEKGEHGYRRGMVGRDLDRDISEHI